MKIPDWHQAMSAQAEVMALVTKSYWPEYAQGWLFDRSEKYGPNAATPSLHAFATAVEDIATSDPLYVTEEMQDLVYHAMDTFDRDENLQLDDVFMPQGFALLAHQFVTEDIHGKQMGWRAVSWRYREIPVQVEGDLNNPEVKPCITMMLWSHLDDRDDYPLPPKIEEQVRQQHGVWGVAHATTIPFDRFNDRGETANEGDPKASWLVFWRVMQRLMAERIVVKSRRHVPRPEWRRAKRAGLDLREVIVVELRREERPSEKLGGTANYSHRFVRVGHWRNQWHPSLKQHRQRWIGKTIVGDPSLPLVVKDRVWVWDR